jgi:2-polyprenyl-3-methyl-5-hydroxy-6-metoxy-1,4-benzoquinol methylase
MTLEEVKQEIDYFVGLTSGNTSTYIATLAVIVSVASILLSLYTFIAQRSQNKYFYLANSWSSLYELLEKYPKFMDLRVTENYFQTLSRKDSIIYDVYCRRAWGYVEDILSAGFADDKQFEPTIRWVTAYHYTWLRRNPVFFITKTFWDKIDSVRKEPNLIFRYCLPHAGDDVDWDNISGDYHKNILGPFAPEMVKQDNNGQSRNLLLNYLGAGIAAEDLKKMRIADFGCGPGDLIHYVAGRVRKLTGVDSSQGALAIARSVAAGKNLEFEAVNQNFLDLDETHKYDMIFSVNSIITKTREDVIKSFKKHARASYQMGSSSRYFRHSIRWSTCSDYGSSVI